jgi:D-tagatose-1,6-bisphosphate aldolase subunit GatZ/KbaZ
MTTHHLDRIISSHQTSHPQGIASICSAHPWVLRAAFQQMRADDYVLIEATCNQVNQFGGYTGMTPADFVAYVRGIAAECGFPFERVILGGDHLGPNVWQSEESASAMEKSIDMIRAFVRAGFVKIHLDASMRLADDPPGVLDPELSARRAAQMAKAAEQACSVPPRYVIGTEVPVPGGAKEHEEGVAVTTPASAAETIELARAAFRREGIEAAFERVIAVVVQPGVEFGDDFVLEYAPEKAAGLARFIETQPGLVYEAHSTDYQTKEALAALVRDHFGILKVGPGLTFAFREAAFALAMMEAELLPPARRSWLIETLDEVMQKKPTHWMKYYQGDAFAQAFARKYSLSDRSRYYWPEPPVQAAFDKLLANLGAHPIPIPLLDQYSPQQCERIRAGLIANMPAAILLDRVQDVLRDYAFACRPEEAVAGR